MKYLDENKFINIVTKINEVVFNDEASDFYSHVLETSLNEVLSSLEKCNNSKKFSFAIQDIKRLSSGKHMFEIMMSHVKSINKPQFMVMNNFLNSTLINSFLIKIKGYYAWRFMDQQHHVSLWEKWKS